MLPERHIYDIFDYLKVRHMSAHMRDVSFVLEAEDKVVDINMSKTANFDTISSLASPNSPVFKAVAIFRRRAFVVSGNLYITIQTT